MIICEKVQKYNMDMDNGILLENTCTIKQEFEDLEHLDNKISVSETTIHINDIGTDNIIRNGKFKQCEVSTFDYIKQDLSTLKVDNTLSDIVKIDNEKSDTDAVKLEFNNRSLFCDHCHAYYEDYCTTCGMLLHILNGSISNNMQNSTCEDIPKGILEIRESSGDFGVFALKGIPKGVRFGPFTGLGLSECSRKLNRGKFTISEDKGKFLNWMQFVSPADDAFQQNLVTFQWNDNLYYRSTREINVGEELLVYFGEGCEDSLNKNNKMDFVPVTEEDIANVFACTFCCVGFSSKLHLVKHKTVCLKEDDGKFSIEELVRCSFCKIYMDEKEYMQYHMAHCCERNIRKCIPSMLDNTKVESRRRKPQRMHACTHCNYKSTYRFEMNSHVSKHYEVKTHRCVICCKRFKTKRTLRLHTKNIHANVEVGEGQPYSPVSDTEIQRTTARRVKVRLLPLNKQKQFKCSRCKFQTKYKYCFKNHIKVIHLKEYNYKCAKCEYKTNEKLYLERHVKTKHLKEFDYECETCGYQTNDNHYLEDHVKSIHLKEFRHNCELCEYKTNKKSRLENHVRSVHLKEFNHNCGACEFKTNCKSHLRIHTKTKHLKEFNYECDTCGYKTNRKSSLDVHAESKHLSEFSYECERCDYKTKWKACLERHARTQHVQEFGYACDMCDYKTQWKSSIEIHINSKHLKEFYYKCESCQFRTNHKSHLKLHVKSLHLQEFDYKCERCAYKTNKKTYLNNHIKNKHSGI